MFIVILKFGGNEALAAKLMEAHMACIKQGFDDGVFLVGGDIQPDLGGALIPHGVSRVELEKPISRSGYQATRLLLSVSWTSKFSKSILAVWTSGWSQSSAGR